MLGWNHNRGQEIKPYLFRFCQISTVYGLLFSPSLTLFHFTVCQLSCNLLTIGVVYYLLVFGSMLLPFHSVHFIDGFSSIWHPNFSDINRVILPLHQFGVEFSNYCCISRLLMLAKVSPTSLSYQFLERGDGFAETSFSDKPLTSIVLFPDGESFFLYEIIFLSFLLLFFSPFSLLHGNWLNFWLFRRPVLP